MFAQTLRASRSSIVRVASNSVVKRTFIIPTAVRQVDIVQDLYLRELKAYKSPPVKASDADAHVQKFSPPKTPKSPEEADIANELKAYEASTVDVEGQSEGGATAADEGEFTWFEEEAEEDEVKH